MPLDFSPEDVSRPTPAVGLMLRRGATRRCPRCGAGHLFRTWWSIEDRCPRCGVRFVREEGYFTGVYLLNFSAVLAVLFVLIMGATIYLSSHPGTSLVPFLVVGVAIAVALPLVLYPFARTLWAALDLAMNPMELDEILDAAEADVVGDVPSAEAEGDGGAATQ